jgi:hypothetical protein
MKMTDAATLTGARATDEGYLVANVRTARIGTQDYRGSELDRPDLDTVTVYRDESEVFRKASLQTFGLLPVTDDHPADLVTADTARMVSVGTTSEEVLRDGEYLRIGIKLTDAATIRKVQDGKRELSVGYTSELVWGDGIAPDGTAYQARQTNIVGNHIAIVDAGRAGPLARIGDSQPVTVARWGASPIYDEKDVIMADAIQTRTVLIDGLSVVTTDAGAQALEKLQGQITDAQTTLAAKDGELAAKDVELAAKDAKIAEMAKATLSDADLDAKVAARADLIGKAKAIAKDVETTGLSDAAIRKAAVVTVLGDAALTGKPDAYIDAYFDILSEDAAKGDPVADALTTGVTVATDARAEYVKSLGTAYLQPVGKGA